MARWRRLVAWLESCVCLPTDDGDVRADKLLVLGGNAVLTLSAAVWGLFYALVGAWWSAAFPWAFLPIGAVGVAHLLATRRLGFARRALCYGMLFCSLGFDWTLGGAQQGTIYWSILAPQIALLTGAHVSVAAFLLLLCLSAYASILAAATILGPEAVTPQHVPIPTVISASFQALNFIVPGSLTFVMMVHLISRLKNHRLHLEQSLQEAERLAHHIANLDVEDIVDADFHQERILEVLQLIACNLKLYRPYIPRHLLQRHAAEDDTEPDQMIGTVSNSPSDRPISTSSTSMIGPFQRSSLINTSTPSSRLKPRLLSTENPDTVKDLYASQSISPPPKTLASLELPQVRKRGTLLFIRLHRLEDCADDATDAECVATVAHTAALFVEAVLTAVKPTKGVVHSMHHNECLVTWNYFTPCGMHAQNACMAAVAIRKMLAQLQTASPRLPLAASMGIWTGPIICGSVGTKDYKAPSMVGPGVSRVVRLQRYAAASGRSIVANAEVHRGISSAPRSRLLLVDIVQFQSMRTADDYELGFTPGGTQLHPIYEVVDDLLQENSIEWMYALQNQTTGGTTEIDAQIAGLLQQAQNGIRSRDTFLTSVRALRQCGDKAVAQVCGQPESLLLAGHLARPFCRVNVDRWTPEFAPTFSPRAQSQAPYTRFESLSTVGEEIDLEDPQPQASV